MTRKSKKRVEVSDDEGGDHGGGSSSAAVATTRPSKLPDDLIPAYDAVVREFTSTMMVRCVCESTSIAQWTSCIHSNARGGVQHFFTAHDRSLTLQTRPIFSRYGAIYALCQILERVLPAGARRTELESHVALKWVASLLLSSASFVLSALAPVPLLAPIPLPVSTSSSCLAAWLQARGGVGERQRAALRLRHPGGTHGGRRQAVLRACKHGAFPCSCLAWRSAGCAVEPCR